MPISYLYFCFYYNNYSPLPEFQLIPGHNFIELLKHKILLKQTNPCSVKSGYRPRLHSIVMLS